MLTVQAKQERGWIQGGNGYALRDELDSRVQLRLFGADLCWSGLQEVLHWLARSNLCLLSWLIWS